MKPGRKCIHFMSFAFLLFIFFISSTGFLHIAAAEDLTHIELTEAEIKFIEEHPVIHLAVDPNFVPYEFFDTDGVYKGIAADYIDLICERTGLHMEVAAGLTWSEAYEKVVNKELDVLPCISMTKQRQLYFFFSEPYYTFQRAIFIKNDNDMISTFDDLENQTVAVQENSSHHSYLSQFDSINLSLYPDVETALLAVSNGNEPAFVGNYATSSYLLKSLGITNLKYITTDSGENQSLYFAVRNDWPELSSIIDKALATVTEEEAISITNKWIGVSESPDYSKIIRIAEISGIIIALVMLVSGFWIIRLRKEIAIRKKAQVQLRIAKEEAERANEIKSMFLARMSHEIRTPLNAIMGMSYLFKKTDLSITQSMYMGKLTQAARNMLGIINDILDFSKIEAGKIEIEKIPFDLDKLLQHVISIESVKIEEQGVELILEQEPRMPHTFLGDPVRIEQVLLNVVNNAIKFTSEGNVLLSVRVSDKKENICTIEFCIKDTGVGMTSEQLARLFIPFDQGDSSINRRFGGTGLGMSIVKNLVELMDGEIKVKSVVDEGTVFDIRLPLEESADGEKTVSGEMAANCFGMVRALVLDKNETGRILMENCLRSFGISYDVAVGTQDALLMMRQADKKDRRPYNLMIVDYATPEEYGIEYIIGLRSHMLPGQNTKYILIAPISREDLFDQLEPAGIDFGISKPIIPSVLYNGIIELFCVKPPENQATVEKKNSLSAPLPYHILLVEDNKTNQFIAQSILEQAGFKVSLADDGRAGYRSFCDHHHELDLILMDVHMPDMDGYEASDLIKAINPGIPIIAMTADAVTGVQEKCRAHGMAYYVSKPFEPDELIKTILDAINAKNVSTAQMTDARNDKELKKVLDTADGLRRLGGDRSIYNLILQEFLHENEKVSQSLKDTIERQAYAEAEQIVHKNKSSSGNIGAKTVYTAAADLQKALAAEDLEAIAPLCEKFTDLLECLLVEIKAFLKE